MRMGLRNAYLFVYPQENEKIWNSWAKEMTDWWVQTRREVARPDEPLDTARPASYAGRWAQLLGRGERLQKRCVGCATGKLGRLKQSTASRCSGGYAATAVMSGFSCPSAMCHLRTTWPSRGSECPRSSKSYLETFARRRAAIGSSRLALIWLLCTSSRPACLPASSALFSARTFGLE